MIMRTSPTIFRVAVSEAELGGTLIDEVRIPEELRRRIERGHGLVLADYDDSQAIGRVRALGIVQMAEPELRVAWSEVDFEIRVDSGTGRFNWRTKTGFNFAPKKIRDYGLDRRFREAFPVAQGSGGVGEGLSVDHGRPVRTDGILPREWIGKPTAAPGGGWLYVLRASMGYKLGRTMRIGQRMRGFQLTLPFDFEVLMCLWFDDHVEAERYYHGLFAPKRLKGEWFALDEADLELLRTRQPDHRSPAAA